MRKALLVAAGSVSLSIGVVGVFVPLLPTTPFLLLSAACFVRSSDRLYQWLIRHPLLGTYIRCYREYRAVSLRAKAGGISLLWATIGYAAAFVVDALWGRLLLLAIAVGVTWHLLSLRTLTREMIEKPD